MNEDIDKLVGGIAIVLGALALLTAIFNWDACFQILKIRWLDSRWGRGAARLLYAALGIALIALGCAIAMGFGPNKDSGKNQEQGWQSQKLVSRWT